MQTNLSLFQRQWTPVRRKHQESTLLGRSTISWTSECEFSFFRSSANRCLLTKQPRMFESFQNLNLSCDKKRRSSQDFTQISSLARRSLSSQHSFIDFVFRESIASKRLTSSPKNKNQFPEITYLEEDEPESPPL